PIEREPNLGIHPVHHAPTPDEHGKSGRLVDCRLERCLPGVAREELVLVEPHGEATGAGVGGRLKSALELSRRLGVDPGMAQEENWLHRSARVMATSRTNRD